jgi:5-formyltetrahydrofolate cyclo-ligase
MNSNNTPIAMQRQQMRRQLLLWREPWAKQYGVLHAQASEAIFLAVQTILLELKAAAFAPELQVGLYWPIRGEPDWRSHWATWEGLGLACCLPLSTPGEPLAYRRCTPDDPLLTDHWGIAYPVKGRQLVPDVLIAPCVGFDSAGWRLGYGGGYFDRTLARWQVPCFGVAFANQQVELQPQGHDQQLTAVITEQQQFWRGPAGVAGAHETRR